MAEHRRLLVLDRSVKEVVLTDRREFELPAPQKTGGGAVPAGPTADAKGGYDPSSNTQTPPAPASLVTVNGPGIYDAMPAEQYHADPCAEPSLSASIAKVLCSSSAAHARQKHPRLNPQHAEEEAGHFDIGTAAHALLLEGESGVAVVDAPDWRTKAARAARDAARAAGKTPLLARVWADVQAMVNAARAQLDAHTDGGARMFTDGKPEQTLIWQEDNGIWCRARLDWLRTVATRQRFACDDYKSTGTSANPDAWTRGLFSNGFDVQVAFHLRGVKVLTGADATFQFAVQETYPPFALSVVALGPDAMTIAEKKRLYAVEHWERCLRKNKWPGYPTRTCWAELPPWEETAWLMKESGVSDKELL